MLAHRAPHMLSSYNCNQTVCAEPYNDRSALYRSANITGVLWLVFWRIVNSIWLITTYNRIVLNRTVCWHIINRIFIVTTTHRTESCNNPALVPHVVVLSSRQVALLPMPSLLLLLLLLLPPPRRRTTSRPLHLATTILWHIVNRVWARAIPYRAEPYRV